MFTAVLVALFVSPAADLNEAAKKELKAVEGDGTVVSGVANGEERESPAGEHVAVTIKGTTFTFGKFGDGAVTALDATTDPKILDFKMLRKPASDVTNEAI